MFGTIGPMELILILVIALVIFGPRKLPEIGKALGDAIREFKKQTEKIGEDVASSKPEPKIEPPAKAAEIEKDKNGKKKV
jgi:sec-independent protein translocase protein TatA